MAVIILPKRSNTPGAVPLPADLVANELAINPESSKLFSKTAAGAVVRLGAYGAYSVGDSRAGIGTGASVALYMANGTGSFGSFVGNQWVAPYDCDILVMGTAEINTMTVTGAYGQLLATHNGVNTKLDAHSYDGNAVWFNQRPTLSGMTAYHVNAGDTINLSAFNSGQTLSYVAVGIFIVEV